MPQLIVLSVVLLLVNWWTYRAVTLARARQRAAASKTVATGSPRDAAIREGPRTSDLVARAAEPITRAFPLRGVPPSRTAAAALEQLLRRVRGVTTAYVSPVTALAYLAYLPAQVTEQQLAQVMRRDGYRVGRAAQRFDWHRA
jgi:hypothetical protein